MPNSHREFEVVIRRNASDRFRAVYGLWMERLSGTRYTYTKTRVAFLVPFIFAVPGVGIFLFIVLLNSRALVSGELLAGISLGTKIVAGTLLLVGVFVAWDLWLTFRRTVSEEIWITDREIVWVGNHRKILVRSPHYDILGLKRLGSDPEGAWQYEIETANGNIRFTRSLEHAEELIQRVEAFLSRRTAAADRLQ